MGEVMTRSGQVALGRLVMHQRERLMPLLAVFSRSNREVKNPAEFFDRIPSPTCSPTRRMVATQIIRQLEGPFDPACSRTATRRLCEP
jgi:DNA end-binding protein Ku